MTMEVKDSVVDFNVDILALTETWLRPHNMDDVEIGTLCPTGYTFLHVPRKQGRGDGVCSFLQVCYADLCNAQSYGYQKREIHHVV